MPSLLRRSRPTMFAAVVAALLLTDAAAKSAVAADVPSASVGPTIQLSADGETIYVIGTLSEGSFLKFDAALLDAPRAKRVYLASIGGMTIEGRLFAALIRKRQLDTYVEYYCASACTQVFVAGRERVIGRDAQLGFHQAVVVDKDGQAKRVRLATERKLSPTLVYGINGNDTLRLAYEQAGIDPAFIAKVLEKSHSEMWTPPAAELLAARVITRQAAAPQVPPPPGGHSLAEVRALLGQRPLWIQAERSLPGPYREAVNDAWLWANSGIEIEAAIDTSRTRLIEALTPRLITASDARLEELLAFHARTAREQREAGYPLCDAGSRTTAKEAGPDKATNLREEDLLLAGIIAAPPAASAPSRDEALNTFASEVMPAFAKAYRRGDAEDAKGSCRYSYRVYEAIADLPPERRIKAYRAMLALPKFLTGSATDRQTGG